MTKPIYQPPYTITPEILNRVAAITLSETQITAILEGKPVIAPPRPARCRR